MDIDAPPGHWLSAAATEGANENFDHQTAQQGLGDLLQRLPLLEAVGDAAAVHERLTVEVAVLQPPGALGHLDLLEELDSVRSPIGAM
jgi:hypothetical protein